MRDNQRGWSRSFYWRTVGKVEEVLSARLGHLGCESSGWFSMGGHGRYASMRGLGLMCAELMKTCGRGVRSGTIL